MLKHRACEAANNNSGVMVKVSYQMASMQLRQPPVLSMKAFYHLTLAQFHLQMIKASYERKGQLAVEKIEAQEFVSLFFNFDTMIMSHFATLKALSSVLYAASCPKNNIFPYYIIFAHSAYWLISSLILTRSAYILGVTDFYETLRDL